MNCPTCHSPNEPDARFCKNCGGALIAGEALAIHPPHRSSRLPLIIGGVVVMVSLAIAAFWLLSRPADDATVIDPTAGGAIDLGGGASLTLLPENLNSSIKLKAAAVSPDDVSAETAAQSGLDPTMLTLPARRSLASDIYYFDLAGADPPAATLALPVADFDHRYRTIDLYGWTDHTWQRLPVQVDIDHQTLKADLESLPGAVALMHTEPVEPIITADMSPENDQLAGDGQTVTELLLAGFTVQADGRISPPADIPTAPQGQMLIPSLRNWREDGTPTAAIAEILADPAQRQRHIEAIVGLTLSGGYPAVQLDYRQLDAAQRQPYSQFIADLAAALHGQNRTLVVRVAAPSRKSTSEWETGAYDWAALGQLADRVQVPLPSSPQALASGETEALLGWAVSQIDRAKVQPVVSLYPVDAAGDVTMMLLADVLTQLGPLAAVDADNDIHPGDEVTLTLTGLTTGRVELDPATKMLHIAGTLDGEARQIYFPTDTALAHTLEQVARYNVAGVAVENLINESIDAQKWTLLQGYRELAVPPVESKMGWVWTVTGSDQTGATPVDAPLSEAAFHWTAPDKPGEYRIALTLSLGDDPKLTLPVGDMSLDVAPKPVAARTPTPQKKRPSPTPKASPSPTPTAAPAAPSAPPPPPPPSSTYQLAYSKWDGQFHNLYVADTNGNNEQLIFTRAAGPAWSPDMKRLFFAGEQGVGQQIRDNRLACEFGTISDGIVAIDLAYPLRDICQVQSDSWFCERKTIDLQQAPSDVCTANGVSVYQNLDWKVGSARWASPAPDGDAVAFDAKPGGGYSIYFRAMLGTSQQFHFELVGEQGSWSPDGQRMVYRSGRDNKSGLWISNRDDSGHTLVTNDGTDSFPTWSADGRTIAFARNVNGNLDIYVMNADGSNVQRLTDAPGHDTLPVYTPGGDLIFRSDRTGSWGIWRMRGDGSDPIEIIPNAGVGPDWAYSRMDVK